jgi:hypothetical protein
MIAIQAFLVIAGFGGLGWAMVAWMVRANRREHEIMARRHEEWMANGSNPDEKPNFFSGNSGG